MDIRQAAVHALEETLALRSVNVDGASRRDELHRRRRGGFAAHRLRDVAFGATRGKRHRHRVVGAHDAIDELLAREKCRRVDPHLTARPPFDVWRREQVFAHARGSDREGQRLLEAQLEDAQRPDDELDWRFDEHAAIRGCVERIARQDLLERDANVVLRIAKLCRDPPHLDGVDVRRNELAPQFRGNVLRGLGSRDHHGYRASRRARRHLWR